MPDVYVASDQKKKKSAKKRRGKRSAKEYSEVMRKEGATKNPLAAFAVRPKKVRVEVQDNKEQILLLLRRHVITNVGWVLVAILMLVAPLLMRRIPFLLYLPFRFKLMTIVLWYLISLGFILEQFLSWYFNVYIVTDERIIDVDFLHLIYKNISTAKVDQIQDITVETSGALRSILDFGTVYIQTAGERREFEFEDVPQPQKVSKFLNELILEEEREKLEGRVR